jgi:hypothetical protein
MVVTRTHRLSMLISDDEWAMLQAVAEKRGVTASDWVRMHIRDAYEAEGKPKKPKR